MDSYLVERARSILTCGESKHVCQSALSAFFKLPAGLHGLGECNYVRGITAPVGYDLLDAVATI